MVKLIALIKRRPEISPEDFRRRYEAEHAALFARSIPAEVADAIDHYAQNHSARLGGGSEPAFDCVTEFSFRDMDALRVWSSWYLGDAGKVLRDDEEHFMDTGARVVLVTEQVPLAHR